MPTTEERLATLEASLKRCAKKPTKLQTIKRWGETFGLWTLLVAGVTSLLVYLITQKQIEKANDRIGELLLKIGAAEAKAEDARKKAEEIESSAGEVADLVNKLRKANSVESRQVLALLTEPQAANDLLTKLDVGWRTISQIALVMVQEREAPNDPALPSLHRGLKSMLFRIIQVSSPDEGMKRAMEENIQRLKDSFISDPSQGATRPTTTPSDQR